jgi:hypothetical protein
MKKAGTWAAARGDESACFTILNAFSSSSVLAAFVLAFPGIAGLDSRV